MGHATEMAGENENAIVAAFRNWQISHEIQADSLPITRGHRQRTQQSSRGKVGGFGHLADLATVHVMLDIAVHTTPVKPCAWAGEEVAADGAKVRVSVNICELGECINVR